MTNYMSRQPTLIGDQDIWDPDSESHAEQNEEPVEETEVTADQPNTVRAFPNVATV